MPLADPLPPRKSRRHPARRLLLYRCLIQEFGPAM